MKAKAQKWTAVGHTNNAFGIKTTRWSLRSTDGEIVADFGPGFIGNTIIGSHRSGGSKEDCEFAAMATRHHAALVDALKAQDTDIPYSRKLEIIHAALTLVGEANFTAKEADESVVRSRRASPPNMPTPQPTRSGRHNSFSP